MAQPSVPTITPPSKRWYESRIIWVQIISILIAVLTYLMDDGVLAGLGLPSASKNWVLLAMVVLSAITVGLRFDTTRTLR